MGSQQLLLIILAVLVVGIAIIVGVRLFNSNAVSNNRNAVIHDLQNLQFRASAYYKLPVSQGGGGNRFNGYSIPPELANTKNGSYEISIAGSDSTITFQGTGTEEGESPSVAGGKVRFTMKVFGSGNSTLTQIN